MSILGLFLVLFLTVIGTLWAYFRGGNDFSVFYEAWHLVLTGHGDQIYRVSPDRFLYSPGFAWLLAPLGLVSKEIALGIWCAAKIWVVFFLIKKLSEPWQSDSSQNSGQNSGQINDQRLFVLGITSWGVILLAKPILIDFSYGQVNLFILGACVWGLIGHFDKKSNLSWDICRWIVLTFAAVAKLYPLPLLLVPWSIKRGIKKKKLVAERFAIVLAVFICFILPIFSQGWDGTCQLLLSWRDAVLAKGLPLESHNQSFIALLYHYLSGHPTSILAEGARPLLFGQAWLSQDQIFLLSLSWTLVTLGVILGWILVGEIHLFYSWIPVLIGLLIVPSHLIWKPYFVMSIPLSVCVFHQSIIYRVKILYFFLLAFFIGVNLTGFDFIGHHWAAHVEAASFLLVLHLILIFTVIRMNGGSSKSPVL